MTIGATNVVAPVFATTEVVPLLSSRVTGQAGFGDFFGALVLEGAHLCRITFFNVRLAWTVTGLAASYMVLPTPHLRELRVRSV